MTTAGNCVPPFKGAVPCKPSASGTLSFNTAALPDGVARVAARDHRSDRHEHRGVRAGAGAHAEPGRRSAIRPSVRRCDARVGGLKGTRKSAVTHRSGRATVTGQIAGAGAGVVVNLLSRERRSGAAAVVAATAVTGADGSYSLAVAGGTVAAVARRVACNPPARASCCSKALDIRVPARATLKASPRSVRAGSRVRLTGRLLGGRVPARGKLIDVQARERGAGGRSPRCAAARRGRSRRDTGSAASAPRKTYPMRVRVRPDAAYPFAVGYSRGGRGPRAVSARCAACRRWTRWPRRSRRRARWRVAAARAVLAERRAELLARRVGRGRSRRAGAGVGA